MCNKIVQEEIYLVKIIHFKYIMNYASNNTDNKNDIEINNTEKNILDDNVKIKFNINVEMKQKQNQKIIKL